jgi:hypothetical protein
MTKDQYDALMSEIEHYFATVTPEQFEKDLADSDFEFYNSLDSPIVYTPKTEEK